jgi:hypothetical protein
LMKRPNPARTDALRIALCLALVVILLFPVLAAGVETESVESEGSAAIQNNNLAQAREQAISLALRGALEKVLSSAVSPQVLVARKSVISEKVYPVTERYILGYRILREAEQDGAYAVRIEATVDSGSLKGDLRSLGLLGAQGEAKTGPGFSISLIVLGRFASHHDFVAFREMLAGMPPIRSVVPRYLSQDRFEMGLESVENSQVIARELSKKRFKGVPLRVLRVEAASIEIAIQTQGVSRE